MTTEENKAIARRYIELFNQGEIDKLGQVVVSDVVDHYRSPERSPGLEGLKEVLFELRAGFPDMYVTIEDLVSEGDLVVVRATAQGTHRGEYAGVAPTGKQVTIPVIAIYRISQGKITDRWNLADQVGLLRQLSAVEEPLAAGR